MNTPWQDLPAAVREAILQGTGDQPVTMAFEGGLRTYKTSKPFEGVIPNMQRRWRETDSAWEREELGRYQRSAEHPSELKSLMRTSYAVFCLNKKLNNHI